MFQDTNDGCTNFYCACSGTRTYDHGICGTCGGVEPPNRCAHDWQDDGDALQIVCRKCGERYDVDLSISQAEADAFAAEFSTAISKLTEDDWASAMESANAKYPLISQATGKRIGCIGHDCAECAQERTLRAPLTADDLRAVRSDPLCVVDDRDEMYKRLGWLVCAFDAIVAHRLKTPNVD